MVTKGNLTFRPADFFIQQYNKYNVHFFNWLVTLFQFPEIVLIETVKNKIKFAIAADKLPILLLYNIRIKILIK